jgi:hypothetical protein
MVPVVRQPELWVANSIRIVRTRVLSHPRAGGVGFARLSPEPKRLHRI